jgi:hypothetical protein
LTVSDGVNTSSADTVTITIDADDDAPTADAGADQTVAANATVQLSATGRDAEGRPVSFAWRQVRGSAVALSDASAAAPTFVAPTTRGGETLVFEVDVTDGRTTATDAVTVVVAANEAPEVAVQAPSSSSSGDAVVVAAIARDAEGDGLTYRWSQVSGPPANLTNADQPSASFIAPTVSEPTHLSFEVAVSDGGSTTTQVVVVGVAPVEVRTPDTSTEAPASATEAETAPEPVQQDAPLEPPPLSLLQGGRDDPAGQTETTTSGSNAETGDEEEGPAAATSGLTATSRGTPTDGPDQTEVEARRGGRGDTLDGDHGLTTSPAFGEPDLVIAEAGRSIEIAATLPVPAGASVEYVWTQIGGTPVAIDETADGKLHVHLPEVFAEEELVFQVALLSGTDRLVQEIAVEVQPVTMTQRPVDVDDVDHRQSEHAATDVPDVPGRGLGRIWASLLAFLGATQGRTER